MHRLRKILGEDDAVILVDGRVNLSNRYFWLDTWALQDAFEEIDIALRTTPTRLNEDSTKHLTDGLLHLYAGGFLGDESEHSCYATCRERFRTMFHRRPEKLTAHWQQCGNWSTAAACYEQAVEVDARSEDLYRSLMICYRELGRPVDAVEVYEHCCTTLAALPETSPSAETVAIGEAARDEANRA